MIGGLLAAFRRSIAKRAERNNAVSMPANPVPHPANVPGPFYVVDGCCMACGVWEIDAPGLLEWLPDVEFPHCYVARQPVTDGELNMMVNAMRSNEVDCIRVRNCGPDWMARLLAEGLGEQIDLPPTKAAG